MTRPFRFSVQLGPVTDPHLLASEARRAEGLGYSGVSLTDHLREQCGPLVGLAAMAAATSTVKITAMVLANDFRHPVMLAKELATLDRMSDGRLEVGMGAGWLITDYQQGGIRMDRPRLRIERLEEAISVLEGCFADGPFDFQGNHYWITGLDSQPKPHQRPRPPLMVGGGGARILSLAARRADIVGLNASLRAGVVDQRVGSTATAEATDEKLAVVRGAAGSRFNDIEMQTLVQVAMIDSDRNAIINLLAPGFGLTADQGMVTPHALVGTVDECCEQLESQRERWGISHITLPFGSTEAMAPVVERLTGN